MARTCPTPRPFNAVAGTVVFLTLLFFVSFISRLIFSPLFPAIEEDMGISSSQAGSLFFFATIGSLVGSWASGLISARFAHRGAIFLSVFGAVVGLIIAYFAESLWQLRSAFVLLGFCAGLQSPSSVAVITAMVRPSDWGKALAVQQMAPALGLVASGLLAATLLIFFSWQTSLLWIAGLCALLGLIFFAFRGVGSFPGEPPKPTSVGSIVKLHSFWVMMLLFALGMGTQMGVFTMLPLYLTQERGMTIGTANTFLGLANIAPLIMIFAAGYVTDRLGEKRAMALSLLVCGAALLLSGLLSGAAMMVCIILVSAFATSFFPPAFKALSRIVQPNFRSLTTALCTPVSLILGGGLLPTGLGFMGENYSFASGFIITGIIVAAGAGATFFLSFVKEMEPGC